MNWRLRGRVAVVTGASSGIGMATAERLGAEGMQVVAGARRRERLDALAAAHEGIHPFIADVTVTDDVDALAAWVTSTFGACQPRLTLPTRTAMSSAIVDHSAKGRERSAQVATK